MKSWYCPNCHRKSDKEKEIIIVLCPCGYYMKKFIEEKS